MAIGITLGGIFIVLVTTLGFTIRYGHRFLRLSEDVAELRQWTIPDARPELRGQSLVERVAGVEEQIVRPDGANGRTLVRIVEETERKLDGHLADHRTHCDNPDAHHSH